jgi:hypothetical protein
LKCWLIFTNSDVKVMPLEAPVNSYFFNISVCDVMPCSRLYGVTSQKTVSALRTLNLALFYFPAVSNSVMEDAQICKVQAVLLAALPKTDSIIRGLPHTF